MAIDYDINPQRDLDDGTYAALPGTTPGEYVQQNATPMKRRMKKDAEGCHPSRWIHELLNNKFTTCDLFDRARAANLNTPFTWQHTHRLMINGNQSFCSNKTQLLSSVCLDCHFHFVFKMAWDEEHAGEVCSPRQARWPVRDAQFPWHHLVWAGSDTEMNLRKENSKYYPILAREYFVCSAPPCTFQVTLEISEPRMASWWIELLLDYDTIRETLRHAKEQDPERYAVATEDWAEQAPMNLNTYLKNLLEATSPEKPRSISKRNKRFSVLFGPRCFSIFRELEFEETKDEQDGIDGGSFTPPLPSPPGGPFGSTETGTYRGFVEDVRSEVQCIIHRSGEPAELCTPGLHADLGCVEVNNTNDSHLINIQRYTLLGVLPNQPKEIVVNAYKRQWELLPNKRKELIDALMGIANDLNDEQLADYAATQSSVFDSQLPTQSSSDDDGIVAQALGFLGLQPPNKYNAETIVAAFRQKLSQEPKMANSARQMLLMIAQASTDDTYQAILLMEANGKMSVATAKAVLGMKEDGNLGPEVIAAARTKISLSNDKEEKATYLDALEAIADLTNATDLKQLVAVQRQENGIEIPKGSSIPDASGRPANYDLPVGLENIGNTCYLNSLLQYLFTVKPVRDIALNYENFKLELNDESIKERLLGGNKMQMDRGEAVVAQAFAQELSDLFNNLETSDKVATRPSQRLANAVLLSTHTLLNDSKPAEPVAGPKPPPLPARPPPEPPAKSSGDVEMANGAVKEERDPVETASTVSSQTLVEDGSDHSYEKVEVPSAATDDQTTDTVMALEGGDSPADTVRPSLKSTETSETIIKSADGTANGEQNADVSMADADEPQTVDSKVLTALEHQKRSSGTDQQDVEEVMGSILNRLQAAIRPSSVDESTGIQLEKIMETFFVTTINYTKKFDDKTYQKEISFDRSITAFPAPEGSCSLYDALGRNFDQQIIEESKLSRCTAIKTLPPVLHVLIQRSQSMGSKNGNPVEIPETLYLDRYMDAPHDSPTFQQRVQSWAVASRISDLKAQKARVEAVIPTGPFLESCGEEPTPIVNSSWAEDDAMEDGVLDFEREENWDFDGPVDDDFLLVSHPTSETPPTTKAPVKPQGIDSAERSVREMMSNELRQREEDLEKHHAGLKNIPYRLHAVICHRGQLMSGHYWVWIHDFEQDVWRKYNDSNVDVKRNTDEVLATLSTSGEPYFLCYVRDEDKDAYVNVPRRQRPEQTTDADGDVVVANSEPTPAVEHTQDFSPPFGPQKSD